MDLHDLLTDNLENEVRRRAGHILFVYNEKLFLWGGYMEQPHYGTYDRMADSDIFYHKAHNIWIYEPLIDVWYRKSCHGDIPKESSGSLSAVVGQYLYIFGGYLHEEANASLDVTKNTLWRLDLESFEWKQMIPQGYPPYVVDKGTGWAYQGRFYIFGGFGCVNTVTSKRFKPYSEVSFITEGDYGDNSRGWFDQLVYYDTATNRWEWPKCHGKYPCARAAHAVTVIGNKTFLFGGRNRGLRLNDFYSIDLSTHRWELLESNGAVPEGRSWHSLTAISDHQLVLYGGFSTVCQVLKDVWMFDLNSSRWHEVTWVNAKPRLWHCTVNLDSSELIVVGGLSSNILDMMHNKDHAEDMLIIRFSPPSLFKLCLEYLTKKQRKSDVKCWNELTPMLRHLLIARVDPLEIHGCRY